MSNFSIKNIEIEYVLSIVNNKYQNITRYTGVGYTGITGDTGYT